jgi:hypothetical protein
MNSPAKKVLVIVVVLVLFALTILIVDSKLPKKGKDKENPTKTEEVIEEKEEAKSKNKEDKVKDTKENKEDEEIREAEATILSKSGGTISLSVDDEEVTKVLRFDMDEQDYKSVRVGQILHLKYIIKNGEVEVKEVTFK